MNSSGNKSKLAIRPGDYKRELTDLLHEKAHGHARKNKIVASATIKKRKEVLFLAFRQLRELGFKLQSVQNLRPKHIQALFKTWEQQNISASTLQQRHSVLKTFMMWIGRPGAIQPLSNLVSNPESAKRVYRAVKDKSWSSNNVDFGELLAKIEKGDHRVAVQLQLLREFGLRVREVAMFKPCASISLDEKTLIVKRGTKGGRLRHIAIQTEAQRAVLAKTKELAGLGDNHIGDPYKSLKQNIRHFRHVMEKFGITKSELGVTPHGLRHEYANDRFEEESGGFKTPVRGGVKWEIPPEREREIRYKISEELGHSRIYITTAYYGSHTRPVKQKETTDEDV
nr:integrase domain-containing protein [uncultured Pseudogulbenkiania sp.]